MSDGVITFSTELDNKGMEKQLADYKKKVVKAEDDISEMRAKRDKADSKASSLLPGLDAEKAKLAEMKRTLAEIKDVSRDKSLSDSARAEAKSNIPQASEALADQKTRVQMLQREYNKLANSVENYDAKIEDATMDLNRNKEKAGEIAAQLAQTGPSSERMANAMVRAQKNANRFALRLKEVVRSALVFTLITQSLAKFREWMGKVVKTNDEASAAMARLQGALLTLAQPLVEIILPAFTMLVNLLARVVAAVAGLLSTLFGKTIGQSKAAASALNDEAAALEATGDAAKKAGQSLAAFDEINTLSSGDSSAASSAAGTITPDFNFETADLETDMSRILGLVKIIGAALLAWKLSGTLTDKLGTFIGMLMAIEGGILLAKGAMDAWNNGVTWDNIRDMLLGTFLLVAGLSAVLGATAGGIALVISGFAMMVVGLKDVLEQGWTMKNLFLTIAGILAAGIGIGVLTGSWIPALVAAIGSILLAITVLTGNGGQLIDNLKQIFSGFITFVDGILTGDLSKILDGAKTMVKGAVNTVLTIVGSLVNAVIKGLNWLASKINSVGFTVPEWVPGVGGKSFSPKLGPFSEWKIPQLATGAVIPPNREFLAVLGDQTSGNNIEAPESLIRKIVREEAGSDYTELLEAILAAIKAGKIMRVDKRTLARITAEGINDLTRSSGEPILIF